MQGAQTHCYIFNISNEIDILTVNEINLAFYKEGVKSANVWEMFPIFAFCMSAIIEFVKNSHDFKRQSARVDKGALILFNSSRRVPCELTRENIHDYAEGIDSQA